MADIAYQNKAVVYDLLLKTAAETLITIAADPKHLGARRGLTAELHTWGPRSPTIRTPNHRRRRRRLSRWSVLDCLPARLLFVRPGRTRPAAVKPAQRRHRKSSRTRRVERLSLLRRRMIIIETFEPGCQPRLWTIPSPR